MGLPRSRTRRPWADLQNLTIEEAGFLATGKLFETYGPGADPLVVNVTGTPATLDDQEVWMLDLIVEVTIDGERRTMLWRMYVGMGTGGPSVLKAMQTTPDP